jgi:hypothetical protein
VECGINDRLIGLMKSSRLPRLRELSLTHDAYDVLDGEAARRLARLPTMRRLTRLELEGRFPDEVLVPLFEAMPWTLEALTIKGRQCSDYHTTGDDSWLTPSGIAAVAQCPSLKTLREVHIENERVGDGIVDVVAACTAGRLERLALVDVDLTDEGAEALARLPQLAGVTQLDVRGNLLGPEGIAAISRSPHLGGVTSLAIGGRFFNPYYDFRRNQPIGDEGLATISIAPALAAVRELDVANAAIGPDGLLALARSGLAGRLHRLDLSTNEVGLQGAQALAGSRWPNLRELTLRRCNLDGDAIKELAGADFGSLHDLDLSYNSIGPSGAAALSACAMLAKLWRLSLHDNLIGDAGLIALATSPILNRLVELDVEQDCWNYHSAKFGDLAARAVAKSSTLRRLDSLRCGCVGEHYCEREAEQFTDLGLAEIDNAASLRPAMRSGLRRARVAGDDDSELGDPAAEMPRADAHEVIQSLMSGLSRMSVAFGEPAERLPDLLTDLLKPGRDAPASEPVQTAASLSLEAADQIRRNNDFRFRPRTAKGERGFD